MPFIAQFNMEDHKALHILFFRNICAFFYYGWHTDVNQKLHYKTSSSPKISIDTYFHLGESSQRITILCNIQSKIMYI